MTVTCIETPLPHKDEYPPQAGYDYRVRNELIEDDTSFYELDDYDEHYCYHHEYFIKKEQHSTKDILNF